MKNHWLRKFKQTREELKKCSICLFREDATGVVHYFDEQKLSKEPVWDIKNDCTVHGIAIRKTKLTVFSASNKVVIWNEVFAYPIVAKAGNTLKVKLDLTIEKWKLTTLLP